jgi:AcrR family transcriptional regulator
MSASTEQARVDGRAERSRRTRAAIVSAHMDLLRGGELAPTAQRIAESAGISVRLLWVHFADKEALFEATAKQVYEELGQQMIPIDSALYLPQRIDQLVSGRVAYLEALEPFARASGPREASSPTLRDYHGLHVRRLADEIEATFAAELAPLDPDARGDLIAALTTVTTWQSWTTLRDRLSLDRRRAEAVLVMTVGALLGGRTPQPGARPTAAVRTGADETTTAPDSHSRQPPTPTP